MWELKRSYQGGAANPRRSIFLVTIMFCFLRKHTSYHFILVHLSVFHWLHIETSSVLHIQFGIRHNENNVQIGKVL